MAIKATFSIQLMINAILLKKLRGILSFYLIFQLSNKAWSCEEKRQSSRKESFRTGRKKLWYEVFKLKIAHPVKTWNTFMISNQNSFYHKKICPLKHCMFHLVILFYKTDKGSSLFSANTYLGIFNSLLLSCNYKNMLFVTK